MQLEKLPSIDDHRNQLEVAEYVDEIYQYYWVTEVMFNIIPLLPTFLPFNRFCFSSQEWRSFYFKFIECCNPFSEVLRKQRGRKLKNLDPNNHMDLKRFPPSESTRKVDVCSIYIYIYSVLNILKFLKLMIQKLIVASRKW